MEERIIILNLKKREKIELDLNFTAFLTNEMPTLLAWLVAQPTKDGGIGWGNLDKYRYLGRWAGDRIIIVGAFNKEYEEPISHSKNITCNVLLEVADYALSRKLIPIAILSIARLNALCSEKRDEIDSLLHRLSVELGEIE